MRDDLLVAAALIASVLFAVAVSCVIPVGDDGADMPPVRFDLSDDAGESANGRGFGRSSAHERLCAFDACGGPLPDRASASQPQR